MIVTGMDLFLDRMEFEIANREEKNDYELYEILKKHALECKTSLEEYNEMIKMITRKLGV